MSKKGILEELKKSVEEKKKNGQTIATGDTKTGKYIPNLSETAKKQTTDFLNSNTTSSKTSDRYKGSMTSDDMSSSKYSDIYKSLGMLDEKTTSSGNKTSTTEQIDRYLDTVSKNKSNNLSIAQDYGWVDDKGNTTSSTRKIGDFSVKKSDSSPTKLADISNRLKQRTFEKNYPNALADYANEHRTEIEANNEKAKAEQKAKIENAVNKLINTTATDQIKNGLDNDFSNLEFGKNKSYSTGIDTDYIGKQGFKSLYNAIEGINDFWSAMLLNEDSIDKDTANITSGDGTKLQNTINNLRKSFSGSPLSKIAEGDGSKVKNVLDNVENGFALLGSFINNIAEKLPGGSLESGGVNTTTNTPMMQKLASNLNAINKEHESDITREDLLSKYGEDGKYADAKSAMDTINKVSSDTVNAVMYMVPSMAISYGLGGAGILANVGSGAALFSQSFNDSYQEALNEGASEEQAINYAFLEGLNNSVGEFAVGGISGIGEGLMTKSMNAMVKNIGNTPLQRTIAKRIVNSLGEGSEEMIQSFISNTNKQITYDPDSKMSASETLYEGLIGFTMSALMGSVYDVNTYSVYRADYEYVSAVVDAANNIKTKEEADDLKSMINMQKEICEATLADEEATEDEKERAEYINDALESTLQAINENESKIIENNTNIADALNTVAESDVYVDDEGNINLSVDNVIGFVSTVVDAYENTDLSPAESAIKYIDNNIEVCESDIRANPSDTEAEINKAILEETKKTIEENAEEINETVSTADSEFANRSKYSEIIDKITPMSKSKYNEQIKKAENALKRNETKESFGEILVEYADGTTNVVKTTEYYSSVLNPDVNMITDNYTGEVYFAKNKKIKPFSYVKFNSEKSFKKYLPDAFAGIETESVNNESSNETELKPDDELIDYTTRSAIKDEISEQIAKTINTGTEAQNGSVNTQNNQQATTQSDTNDVVTEQNAGSDTNDYIDISDVSYDDVDKMADDSLEIQNDIQNNYDAEERYFNDNINDDSDNYIGSTQTHIPVELFNVKYSNHNNSNVNVENASVYNSVKNVLSEYNEVNKSNDSTIKSYSETAVSIINAAENVEDMYDAYNAIVTTTRTFIKYINVYSNNQEDVDTYKKVIKQLSGVYTVGKVSLHDICMSLGIKENVTSLNEWLDKNGCYYRGSLKDSYKGIGTGLRFKYDKTNTEASVRKDGTNTTMEELGAELSDIIGNSYVENTINTEDIASGLIKLFVESKLAISNSKYNVDTLINELSCEREDKNIEYTVYRIANAACEGYIDVYDNNNSETDTTDNTAKTESNNVTTTSDNNGAVDSVTSATENVASQNTTASGTDNNTHNKSATKPNSNTTSETKSTKTTETKTNTNTVESANANTESVENTNNDETESSTNTNETVVELINKLSEISKSYDSAEETLKKCISNGEDRAYCVYLSRIADSCKKFIDIIDRELNNNITTRDYNGTQKPYLEFELSESDLKSTKYTGIYDYNGIANKSENGRYKISDFVDNIVDYISKEYNVLIDNNINPLYESSIENSKEKSSKQIKEQESYYKNSYEDTKERFSCDSLGYIRYKTKKKFFGSIKSDYLEDAYRNIMYAYLSDEEYYDKFNSDKLQANYEFGNGLYDDDVCKYCYISYKDGSYINIDNDLTITYHPSGIAFEDKYEFKINDIDKDGYIIADKPDSHIPKTLRLDNIESYVETTGYSDACFGDVYIEERNSDILYSPEYFESHIEEMLRRWDEEDASYTPVNNQDAYWYVNKNGYKIIENDEDYKKYVIGDSIIDTENTKPVVTSETANKQTGDAGEKSGKTKAVADKLIPLLREGKQLNSDEVRNIMESVFGGTLGEKAYTIQDLYEAQELAINEIERQNAKVDFDDSHYIGERAIDKVNSTIEYYKNLESIFVSQSTKTDDKIDKQQFSTPAAISYLANYVLHPSSDDYVLEPSAGVGGLASFSKGLGATVYVNEYDERRLNILKESGYDAYFNLDGEMINDTLDDKYKVSAVIMNPPFSASVENRKNGSDAEKRHVQSALERLENGGRAVMILVGSRFEKYGGASDTSSTFKDFWNDIRKTCNIRANIGIDGSNYGKNGTTFNIRMVVIDKTGAQNDAETLTGYYNNLKDAAEALKEIANDRQYININSEPGTDGTVKVNSKVSEGSKGTTGNRNGVRTANTDVSERGSEKLQKSSELDGSGVSENGEHTESSRTVRNGESERSGGVQESDSGTGERAGVRQSSGVRGVGTERNSGNTEGQESVSRGETNDSGDVNVRESGRKSIDITPFIKDNYYDIFWLADEIKSDCEDYNIKFVDYVGASIACSKLYKDKKLNDKELYDYVKLVIACDIMVNDDYNIKDAVNECLTFDVDSDYNNALYMIASTVVTRYGENYFDLDSNSEFYDKLLGYNLLNKNRISKILKDILDSNTINSIQTNMPIDRSVRLFTNSDGVLDPLYGDVDVSSYYENNNYSTSEKSTSVNNNSETTDEADTSKEIAENSISEKEKKAANKEAKKNKKKADNGVFAEYRAPELAIEGAKAHPGKLVESSAMSAVQSPKIKYIPKLAQWIIDKGILSDAQLASISYAGQAHNEILKNGYRKGFFIGDGTGVGKGRQIAGCIVDNFNNGRTKAIWFTEKAELLKDARRDLSALGFDPSKVKVVGSGLVADAIAYDKLNDFEGVLVVPYSRITRTINKKSDLKKLDALKNWVGEDFDGAMIFDEAHNMKNCIKLKGQRSNVSASAKAGVDIQNMLPKARVVYASATGATEVRNMAYLTRLGLWGTGTQFENVNEFIDKVSNSGVSAMELIARDMKARGLYLSRSVSMEGCEYRNVTHKLSARDRKILDSSADAWYEVFENIQTVAEACGADKNKTARNRINSITSSRQRFYNNMMTSMMLPTIIENIKQDLADGKAPVIELVSTNEARTKDEIENLKKEAAANGLSPDDIDFENIDTSAKQELINYVKMAFPVANFVDVEDDYGNVKTEVVTDANGNVVLNKARLAERDRIIAGLEKRSFPENPLDVLIREFGVDNVAEITGRKERLVDIVDENGNVRKVTAKKPDNNTETEAFQNGDKKILIFSRAGGTGRSYHADSTAKNQNQRVHYIIQFGWSADSAMQNIGRTNRTGQVSSPIYKIFSADAVSQKRFRSTIARRLSQLGALTKGQRQTTEGVLTSDDSIENEYGRTALKVFYDRLIKGYYETYNNETGELGGIVARDLLKRMNLLKYFEDSYGNMNVETAGEDANDVNKFQNGLFALRVDQQNEVYSEFEKIYNGIIEKAKEDGTYDTGVETIDCESADVEYEDTVYTDESGAETRYVKLNAYVKPIILETIDDVIHRNPSSDFNGVVINNKTSKIYAVFRMQDRENSKGIIEKRYKLQTANLTDSLYRSGSELVSSFTYIDKSKINEYWEKAVEAVPEYNERTYHMFTGSIMPIWTKIESNLGNDKKMTAKRITTDNGNEYLGIVVTGNESVNKILTELNRTTVTSDSVINSKSDPEFVYGKITKEGYSVTVNSPYGSGTNTLTKATVAGENRVEIGGLDLEDIYENFNEGIIKETKGSTPKYYIANNKTGMAAMSLLLSKGVRKVDEKTKTTSYDKKAGIENSNNKKYKAVKSEKLKFEKKSTEQIKNFVENNTNSSRESRTNNKIDSPQRMCERISNILDLPVYYAHIKGNGTLGYFNYREVLARIRNCGNFDTLTHEVGHFFDMLYGIRDNAPEDAIKEIVSEYKSELATSYSEDEIPGECIAQYFRHYLQGDEITATKFESYVEGTLSKESLEKLSKIKSMCESWYNATNEEKYESAVYSKADKSSVSNVIKEAVVNRADNPEKFGRELKINTQELLWRTMYDENHTIKTYSTNGYNLARRSKDSAAVAKGMFEYQVTDVHGERIKNDVEIDEDGNRIEDAVIRERGNSLRSVIEKAKITPENYDRAGTYLVLRRALSQWELYEKSTAEYMIQANQDAYERYMTAQEEGTGGNGAFVPPYSQKKIDFARNHPPKEPVIFANEKASAGEGINSKQSVADAVREYELNYPTFRQFADDISTFIDDRNDFLVSCGFFSKNHVEKMRENLEFYVPYERRIDSGMMFTGERSGVANQNNTLNRFKGSMRDIVNPIETIVSQTESLVAAAMKSRAMTTIANDITNLSGMGGVMTEIPESMYGEIVGIESIHDRIYESLKNDPYLRELVGIKDGMSKKEINKKIKDSFAILIDVVGDDIMNYNVVPNQNRKGNKDRIVTAIKNGDVVYYQVGDENLYKALTRMDVSEVKGLEMALKTFNSVFKVLTTGMNPFFQIPNFIKDTQNAYVNSKSVNIKETGKFSKDLFTSMYGIIKQTDEFKEYMALGGETATRLSSDMTSMRAMKKDWINNNKTITLSKFINGFRDILSLYNVSEQTNRFAEYRRQIANGASKDMAVIEAHRVTLDFGMQGTFTKHMNNYIPFSAASVNGFVTPMILLASKSETQKQHIAKFLTQAAMLSIIQLAWRAIAGRLFDDEDEEDIKLAYEGLSSWTKNQYSVFYAGNGKFFKIPKSQEYGLLSSVVERMVEKYALDDEEAFYDFADYFYGIIPLYGADDVSVIGTLIHIYKNETFSGSTIEPSKYNYNNENNATKYDNDTTYLARLLGSTGFGSPYQWDYALQSNTGFIGGIAGKVASANTGNAVSDVGKGVADYAKSKFVANSNTSNRAVNIFYDDKEHYDKNANSYKSVGESKWGSYSDVYNSSKYSKVSKLYTCVKNASSDLDEESKNEMMSEMYTLIDAFNDRGTTKVDEWVESIAEVTDVSISKIVPYVDIPNKITKKVNGKSVTVELNASDIMDYYSIGNDYIDKVYTNALSVLTSGAYSTEQIAEALEDTRNSVQNELKEYFFYKLLERGY